MAAHCYNPGTQEAEKEDSEFEASLGNTTRLSPKKKLHLIHIAYQVV